MNKVSLLITLLFLAVSYAADSDICLKKAERAFRIENYDTAITILAGCPATPESYKIRGLAFNHLYLSDSAVSYLSRAYDIGSRDDDLLIALAEALLWKKEFKSAGNMLEEITNKSSIPYRKVYALRLEMLGKFDEAIACYDGILALDKQNWPAHIRKGEVLSWNKQFDEAITILSKVGENQTVPKSLRMYALIRRAEVHAWKKESPLALNELDTVIAMDANPLTAPRAIKERILDAFALRGQILEWNGKYVEAKEAYKNMLIIDPANKKAKLNLEKLLWVK